MCIAIIFTGNTNNRSNTCNKVFEVLRNLEKNEVNLEHTLKLNYQSLSSSSITAIALA